MKYYSEVIVTLKNGIRDPQGSVVENILKRMNLDNDAKVTTGKYFTITVNAKNQDEAKQKVENVCSEVLVNTVLESYKITKMEQV